MLGTGGGPAGIGGALVIGAIGAHNPPGASQGVLHPSSNTAAAHSSNTFTLFLSIPSSP
jgi:hypothetical protein